MNELIKQQFKPKSNFISIVEYSYLSKEKVRISERLTITFQTGSITEYTSFNGDCEMIYLDLVRSESVGKYYHKFIKGVLQGKKLR